MNLDKSKKRIAKRVKMGHRGYPEISISYAGSSSDLAEEVIVVFIAEEGSSPMEERFKSKSDAREDEVIQSAIVKMVERSEAKTVTLVEDIVIQS
jgi:predicted DNA-binding ArsR family transcriptional regulator